MDNPAFWSAKRQAAAIKAGELGSRELLELYIDRIEQINPDINAVITTDFKTARRVADQADKVITAGEPVGPLHGLPVTIKDAIETKGLCSTGGAIELASYIPESDAPVVNSVRRAGANIIGKTNLPRWSGDIQAYNEIYGTTSNPWNLDHVPGGSSGGAAAAVACGLTSFEIGTDIGGSIRFPSAFCGVFGHKPSFGIVPSTGYLDHALGGTTEADVNVIGPITRSAEDLELLLGILLREEAPWKPDLAPPPESLKDLRIATWLNDDFCSLDDVVSEKLNEVVSKLETENYQVTQNTRPDIEPLAASDLAFKLIGAALLQSQPESGFSHRDWLEAHRSRVGIQQRWAEFFEDYDIILMPVCFVPPFPHVQEGDFFTRTIECNGIARPYVDLIRWTMLVGMANLPSTVPPIGLGSTNLPIGIQVVGKYGADLTTIRFASAIADLMGGYIPPPIANLN
ncbi:MAG: amidase [Gammaproteobacteria bacterium]|jgi:amidase|nr:amidase [Gammaproteobacteria bacterium]|tara:strand:- start:32046 stop:33416 length:1371 start_codon:yes stop_codon:yes gene_type:complete